MPNRRSSRTPQKAAESASEELKRRPTFVPDQELPGGRTSPNTTITSKKKVKRDEMESETESGTESEEDEEEEEEVRSPSRRRRRRRRSETETETESEEEKEEAARSTSSSSLRSRRSGRTRNSSRPRSMSPSPEKKKSKPRKKGGSKSLIADLTSSAIYLLFAAVAVVIIARGGAFEDHDKDGDRDFHDAKATLDVDHDGDVDLEDAKLWLDLNSDGAVQTGELTVLWPVLLWLLGHSSGRKKSALFITACVIFLMVRSDNLPKAGSGLSLSSAYDLERKHWSEVRTHRFDNHNL